MQHMFNCPIYSCSLHPDFGRKGNRQYVIGYGEKLTLFEKGWLRSKSTLLHAGEGFVRAISWRKKFIAWANSKVTLNIFVLTIEIYVSNVKALQSSLC